MFPERFYGKVLYLPFSSVKLQKQLKRVAKLFYKDGAIEFFLVKLQANNLQPAALQKRTPLQRFLSELCKRFQYNYFAEHL